MINRNILFYKLMNGSWQGRVVDTLRNLYSKTNFFVKHNSKLSPIIHNTMGVNQGGVASGFLFRKYMSDLKTYLDYRVGVCIDNNVVAHLLWADDLILFSDTASGLQKQLNGLYKFCANNRMIVNEAKSKVMCFGKQSQFNVSFNDKEIEQVGRYKYLGNIIRRIDKPTQDIFADNYKYLGDQARKAMLCAKRKIKDIGVLPPHIMLYIFDTIVRPITTYGSDVWGCNIDLHYTDKVFLDFIKCVLRVKATTCTTIVYGKCGRLPPSVFCHINVLCFAYRLLTLHAHTLAKSVYSELERLHHQGFETWVSKIHEIAHTYGVRMSGNTVEFKMHCQAQVKEHFINEWHDGLSARERPLLRTYRLFKSSFGPESYLFNLKDQRYRTAITKLRASSHILEIERGRYSKPIVPSHLRMCKKCYMVEDEEHFVTKCVININERSQLLAKVRCIFPDIDLLNTRQIFVFLMCSADKQIQKWFGRFIHQSFITRNELLLWMCVPMIHTIFYIY